MKKLLRLLSMLIAASFLLASFAAAEVTECPQIETGIMHISKYGNVMLDISGDAFLKLGYEYGDVIRVGFGDQFVDLPVCGNYNDVDVGSPVCRVFWAGDIIGTSLVALGLNSGNFAEWMGIATQTTIEEDPGYRWDYDTDTPIIITMKEKGGYLVQIELHRRQMSNNREDYPHLTDAEYANFRNIATTGMGKFVLYRSSSPINPQIARNQETDAEVNAAGIKTILNLTDSETSMKAFEDYALTYYSALDVIPLNLIVDYHGDSFRKGIAEGFRFLAAHEGPYLIHCVMGKDRTGFVCAILECLMGASAEEVVADYMLSYYNFYGIEPGDEEYEAIADGNIRKTLAEAFGIDHIDNANLAECAEAYLLEIGMSSDEIAALKARLGTDIE